ncbi:MAG: hypothetical protein LC116_08705 [Bacteroidetes bacterium]|nr:hypothetical protein [Bacteroidota bacterium]MCZ2133239.1 hypothetical protein [Bacteroidota bacterium]
MTANYDDSSGKVPLDKPLQAQTCVIFAKSAGKIRKSLPKQESILYLPYYASLL